MKKILYSMSALFLGGFLLHAQEANDVVVLGGGYENDVYYQLETGDKNEVEANNWDLAFDLRFTGATVRVNSAKGVEMYYYSDNFEDWDEVDTTDMDWTPLYNSTKDWYFGATDQTKDPTDNFDYGWGEYNQAGHAVTGKNIYVIKLTNESYIKFRINGIVDGEDYTLTYADLDGENEENKIVHKPDFANKLFGYFDFTTGESIDREPVVAEEWDLLFTEYVDTVPNPIEPGVFEPHAVAGVLANYGVEIAQIDGVDANEYDEWWGADYTENIGQIGHDWKEFDMDVFEYVIEENRVFFVKAMDGAVWKMVFTGFGGAATGEMEFRKEIMSTVSTAEEEVGGVLGVYPNPASSTVSLLLNNMSGDATQVNIINTAGQTVYENEVVGKTDFEVKNIDVNALQAGVYIVHVTTNNQVISKKLIIQ